MGLDGEVSILISPSRKMNFINTLSLICAGSSLLCDGYQNNVMVAVNLILKEKYKNDYSSSFISRLNNGMLIGQIIGMLLFGFTCDMFSRKNSIVFTTLFMLIGSIIATAAHGSTTHAMFWMMAIGQGICGVGVGGEFPTAAAMTSEAANDNDVKDGYYRHNRGWQYILITNIPLQFGGPLTMSIFLIVWEASGGKKHLSTIWRVMFGIGCIWPILVFLLRMKLADSSMFKKNKFIDFNVPWVLVFRFYWKRLLGTCITFLLYDWIVKSNGTMSSLIIKSVVKHGDPKKTAEWQLLLGTIQLLGIPLGAILCEPLGRKRVMLMGFLGFVVFGIAIGASWYRIKDTVPLFVVLYGLFAAVGHMGPGCMIGLISTECYATSVRGTLYGLSSAFGRAGGAIGIESFGPISNHLGQRWTFFWSAIIGVVAIVWSYLFIPNLTGDDLELEDLRLKTYLQKHKHGANSFGDYDKVSNTSDSHKDYAIVDSRPFTKRSWHQRIFTMDPLNI